MTLCFHPYRCRQVEFLRNKIVFILIYLFIYYTSPKSLRGDTIIAILCVSEQNSGQMDAPNWTRFFESQKLSKIYKMGLISDAISPTDFILGTKVQPNMAH